MGTSVSPLPRMEKKEEEERAAAVFIPPRVVTRADFSPPLLVVRSMRGVGRMIGISPLLPPKVLRQTISSNEIANRTWEMQPKMHLLPISNSARGRRKIALMSLRAFFPSPLSSSAANPAREDFCPRTKQGEKARVAGGGGGRKRR